MVHTPSRESGQSDHWRQVLETSYSKRSLVSLAPGSTVPMLRHQIWLVVRGMVKLGALTFQGDDLVLGLAGPNEPFGDPFNGVEAFEATTLCATDLLCFSWREIERDPQLALGLLQAVAQRHRQSQALLGLMGLRRVEDRLRGFLELLAQEYGQPCDLGLRLNLRLTHQELASALGTTRVTVTRLLGSLREEGFLQIDAQRHLVLAYLPRLGGGQG